MWWLTHCIIFFFQAEDGIRDAQESRGLGDVYKRQDGKSAILWWTASIRNNGAAPIRSLTRADSSPVQKLSLIHI